MHEAVEGQFAATAQLTSIYEDAPWSLETDVHVCAITITAITTSITTVVDVAISV